MKKLLLIAILLIFTTAAASVPWYPDNGCHDVTAVARWVVTTNWLREPIYINPLKKTQRILEYGVITEQLIAELRHNGKGYPVILESRPQKSITRDYIITISKPSKPVVDR